METNIFDIAPVLSDIKICIAFLRGRNLLLNDYICCGNECSKVMDISISDRERFQCNTCKKHIIIRKYSFFENSKLELTVIIAIIYFFCNGSSVTECLKFLHRKVSKVSVIQWFNYIRDVMTTYIGNNPVTFHNGTVHCNETFIGGKRKHHRGRVPTVTQRYLFGITDNKKNFLQFVPKRDFINLIPLITRHVMPGVTINTDGAKVYKKLDQMNYIHKTCTHKDHFVNLVDGTHSNWIENIWSNLKQKIKAIRGSQNAMLDGHVDEYLYRYNRKNEGSIFDLVLTDISVLYPI